MRLQRLVNKQDSLRRNIFRLNGFALFIPPARRGIVLSAILFWRNIFMALQNHPIVIVGMQRSGTSCITQALSHLGVFFGREETFLAPDDNNATGYFEIGEQVRLHKDIQFAFHRPWNSVRPFPENWQTLPQARRAIEQLESLLVSHFDGQERWGFKEPSAALLIPLYESIFKSSGICPHYVICFRNPLEVCDSVNRHARSYLTEKFKSHAADPQTAGQELLSPPLGDAALGVWLRYTLGALHDTIGKERMLVPYSKFLSDPREILNGLVGRFQDWHPTDDEWQASLASVQPSLRRHATEDQTLEVVPPLAAKTYRLCRVISSDQEAFQSGAFDTQIEDLWNEFASYQTLFRAPNALLGNLVATWRGSNSVRASECYFEVGESWLNLSLDIDSPPGSEVIGAFYHQPCVVWIRKIQWRSGNQIVPCQIEAGPSCLLNKDGDLQRLFANAEVFQFRTRTPTMAGPYVLEVEFYLEVDPRHVMEGLSHLVNGLTGLRGRALELEQQLRAIRSQAGKPTFMVPNKPSFGGKR